MAISKSFSCPPAGGVGTGGGGTVPTSDYDWIRDTNNITDWLNGLGGFLGDIFSSLVSPFTSIANAISSIGNWIADNVGKIVGWLDPDSDNFILKVAFVPSTEFMGDFTGDIQDAFEGKFGFVSQFSDTWHAISNTVGQDEWEGISYNNPLIGEVLIINPIAVNAWSYKIKYWIGGAIVLMTIVMTIRRIGTVAGAGK